MALTHRIQEFAGPLSNRDIRANIGWLLSERGFRLIVSFLVSILLARYLGPPRLGILNYALSLKTFFGAFVYMGLSGLLVREIVRSPQEEPVLMGTTFVLKMLGAFLGFLILATFAFVTDPAAGTEFMVVFIIGLSLFPGAFECIEFWFEAYVRSKYSAIAKNIGFTLSSGLKILLVFFNCGLVTIAVVSALEFFLSGALLALFYSHKGGKIKAWTFHLEKALYLLSQSWIIILSGFLSMVYLKVDQVMLRFMAGTKGVGIYSVAAQISEVWYFIAISIAASVFPRLIKLRKEDPALYHKNLQQVFDVLFVISLTVAVIFQILAGRLVPLVYGEAYRETAVILQIHIWAGIFMFQRALLSRWFFIEHALRFSLYSHGLGALSNILLNLALIPVLEGRGAAVATIISYGMSSYFFLFLWSMTRPMGRMITRSYMLPLRLYSKWRQGR
ncbi:MAG: flippase [Thermovirgaceae bacterium]